MSAAVPISSPGPSSVRRRVGWMAAAVAALAVAALLSLAVGSRPVAPSHVLDALLHGGTDPDSVTVRSFRVPRTLIGVMVGAALALAGTALQGVTRNPIADPGVLGISQGASLGVVVAMTVAGLHRLSDYVWFGFTGAAVAAVGVYAVATRGRGGASPVKLALAGAAINALLVSVISGVLTTEASALDEFRFWQVGSIAGRDAAVAAQLWPFLLVGAAAVLASARGLDALALGEDMAKGLGRNVGLVRVTAGLGATVLTGAGVAAAGPIAFLGLAVPHIARALVGTGHRWVLPMAALLGPVILLTADVLGRVIYTEGEVPSGVMTALLGLPFLVTLVRRKAVAA
ncbi:FecCD family ABC transporter permease [Streptomyces abikoensis]|uniref:FecCD family ABC transporter permease n=1 Tax=Streptomyces abikoensis TaxID=97398 RepID=UPI001674E3C6|nr:iron ABC transporter permease [Streptomyces abikoensis]